MKQSEALDLVLAAGAAVGVAAGFGGWWTAVLIAAGVCGAAGVLMLMLNRTERIADSQLMFDGMSGGPRRFGKAKHRKVVNGRRGRVQRRKVAG